MVIYITLEVTTAPALSWVVYDTIDMSDRE